MAPVDRSQSLPVTSANGEPIRVLYVDSGTPDLDRLEDTFDDEQFTIRTTGSTEDAMATIEDVDCIVSTDRVEQTSVEFFERIRADDDTIPCILFAFDPSTAPVTEILELEATDYVEANDARAGYHRLRHRVQQMVHVNRQSRRIRQQLATMASLRDGIGIVSPDGTYRFVNRVYALQFGYTPEEMVGRHWKTVYTDTEVERLESNALPSIADAWRWSGTCTGRQKDGDTFSAQTSLVGLENDGLVFLQSPQR
jgi:PAS domain S-box-containing protein